MFADAASRGGPPSPIDNYWNWVGLACYLLFTVDLLTTYFAVAVVGLAGESNPIVARALAQGPVTLVALNVVGLVLVVALFYALRVTVENATPSVRPYYARFVGAWIAGLVMLGFIVFANNLGVIVFGRSVLAAVAGS